MEFSEPAGETGTSVFSTAIGLCRISWNQSGITRFRLPPNQPGPDDVAPSAQIADVVSRCQRHLSGEPQDLSTTRIDWKIFPDFARRVYEYTIRIPTGSTATYGEIARALGLHVGTSRAVGTVLGANPIPLIIPCHRVISASGKMTGFSSPGGIPVKIKLLALERAELELS